MLRYLGKGGFLSEIRILHGVDNSTVSRTLHTTSSPHEQMSVKQNFHKICGFPKVIGAVDGTLIPIKRPAIADEAAFVCRKCYHAINVQAMCDSSLRYAYRPWLLTPFIEPKGEQEQYNIAHTRTRNTVERAFGVFKARFRCLHKSTGCLWFSPERCSVVIMACFKLHNYCITKDVQVPPGDVRAEMGADMKAEPAPRQCQDGNTARRDLINEIASLSDSTCKRCSDTASTRRCTARSSLITTVFSFSVSRRVTMPC